MLNKVRTIAKNKGQGIVEYALLLAFVVGIVVMLNGTNLGGAVNGLFNYVAENVATVLGDVKDYASALKNWGNKSKEELSKIDNEKRLTIDEEALANLAGYFIGQKKEDLIPLFKKESTAWSNEVILLGHLTNNENGGTDFVGSGDQLNAAGIADVETHIYNWLQHDYGKDDPYDSTKSDSSTRFLFSDYALGNDTGSTFTANNSTYDRGGIKIKLCYDNTDTVIAAKVVVDSFNNGGSAGADSSKGLCVTQIGNLPATANDDFNTNFNKQEVLRQINNN